MEVITLQSGSAGNCVFVRSGETRLLFDAGISGSNAESRLANYGYDIRDCNALVLSHEHYDHISGVGVFHRILACLSTRICEHGTLLVQSHRPAALEVQIISCPVNRFKLVRCESRPCERLTMPSTAYAS